MPTPGQSLPPIIRIDISINRTNHNSIQEMINNIIDMNSKETCTVYTQRYATPTGRDVVPQTYNEHKLNQQHIYMDRISPLPNIR